MTYPKLQICNEEMLATLATKVEVTSYLSCKAHLSAFISGIEKSATKEVPSTGFENLDTALDGGLYPALYGIGAVSSLGKTTLLCQLADKLAQEGHHVLFFSLEMPREEIMAKSISRHSFIEHDPDVGAKTVRDLMVGSRYADYSLKDIELIQKSTLKYAEYADKIFVVEGLGEIGVKEVREAVEKHVEATGRVPIVIIDYLQILQSENDRATDKQNTDRAVMKLKHISRDFKTPVIVISSFNRDNYNNEVTMQAFKESGAIEYSCDILFGLQFKGVGQSGFDINKAKQANPRNVELVILKNRNGETGVKTEFSYYPKYNFFEER